MRLGNEVINQQQDLHKCLSTWQPSFVFTREENPSKLLCYDQGLYPHLEETAHSFPGTNHGLTLIRNQLLHTQRQNVQVPPEVPKGQQAPWTYITLPTVHFSILGVMYRIQDMCENPCRGGLVQNPKQNLRSRSESRRGPNTEIHKTCRKMQARLCAA